MSGPYQGPMVSTVEIVNMAFATCLVFEHLDP